MAAEYPFDMEANSDNQSAQVIQIDSGKHLAVVAVCAALCGIAGALSIWAAYTAVRAEREARMLQYYLLELDARVIEAGVKPADEAISTKLKEK